MKIENFMKLVELSSADKDQYNAFVAAQESGSFLQSWEWGQWQERLGRKAFRFFLYDDQNSILASIQVIQSPLPLGKYYLYIPYGPVIPSASDLSAEARAKEGESLFQGKYIRDPSAHPQMHSGSVGMTQEIILGLQKRYPAAVFIRIEPKVILQGLDQISKKTTNIQPGKTLVINLRQSLEELLAGMRPKTRYNTGLAQRHGVEVSAELIVVPGHGLYVKEALDLITETADRQSFQTFPRGYYQQLLDFFALQNSGGDAKIFLYKAFLGRELLTAAVMIDFAQTRTYLFGGSASHHREVMAPHLLHFTAMQDAKKLGYNSYDFWGIETSGGETPGFVRFKMGFGGQVVNYPGAWDIALRRLFYHGYKTFRKVNRVWLRLKFF